LGAQNAEDDQHPCNENCNQSQRQNAEKLIENLQKTAAEGISANNDLAGEIPP